MISKPVQSCSCSLNKFCTSIDFNTKINKHFETLKEFESFIKNNQIDNQENSIKFKQFVDELLKSTISLLKIDYFLIQFKNNQVF